MDKECVDSWKLNAACRGLGASWFYPYPRDNPKFNVMDAQHWNDKNRAICARCPVRVECLRYALENEIEFDVWGGESPIGRHQLMGRKK
jgi:WhiB family redox-sensing transcriptional regulator